DPTDRRFLSCRTRRQRDTRLDVFLRRPGGDGGRHCNMPGVGGPCRGKKRLDAIELVVADKSVPTLFEWLGGMPALDRLMSRFYERVKDDPILAPIFAKMGGDHPHHVAVFLAEVLGAPAGLGAWVLVNEHVVLDHDG